MTLTVLRLAIIDDYFSRYARLFGSAVSELVLQRRGNQVVLYFPKSRLFGKYFLKQTDVCNVKNKRVWTSFMYPIQIINNIIKDNINIVHIQFEINTFGHPITIALFPFLLIALKIKKVRTITTIHAVIPKDQCEKMSYLFKKLSFLLLISFTSLYKIIDLFSSSIIVHSEIFKKWLIEYGVESKKVKVLHHGIENMKESDLTSAECLTNERIILCFGVLSPKKRS